MEESGFAQKNLVEVILVQEEEGGEKEKVESQSLKVKDEKVFNIHLQVSNTSTLASVSLKNQIWLNYGERKNNNKLYYKEGSELANHLPISRQICPVLVQREPAEVQLTAQF